MRLFNFFHGFIEDNSVTYWSSGPDPMLPYRTEEFWTNIDDQEFLRQERLRQQREQTNRMRNFITRPHNGRGRYPNAYARR